MGCGTVRELLSRIDSKELAEWMAFDSIEPFGDKRADLRQAITSTVIANVNRSKGRVPYKIKDFMAVRPKPRLMTDDEMKKMFKEFAGRQ